MIQDSRMLYKLILLYMLNRVAFPLTQAQISEFILEREYTDYLTLLQTLYELIDAELVTAETNRNRTHLSITEAGRETLRYFGNRLNHSIREDIEQFFREKEFDLRNESSIQEKYEYNASSGEYEAHLTAIDKGIRLVDISLSVPTEEMAASVCENWQKNNQEIYQFLISKLF